MKAKWTATFVIMLFLVGVGRVDALCVKAEKADVRVGPGRDYPIGWTVYRNFPLKKVGTSLSGDWYAVEDIDGDVLWIQKSLVTTRYVGAAVKTDKANVRKGPGKGYGKIRSNPVKKYSAFRVVGRKGQWVKVEDADNTTGWIHRDCLWVQ